VEAKRLDWQTMLTEYNHLTWLINRGENIDLNKIELKSLPKEITEQVAINR
jgi:uncharacterized protein YqgQ